MRFSHALLIVMVAASGAYAALPGSSASDAERARQRAAAFDRQARVASTRESRAMLEAAGIAARVQQAEAALGEAARRQVVIAAERRRLDADLARKRAPTMKLMTALGAMSRRPPALLLLQPGSLSDMARLRAITAAIAPQVEARAASVRTAIARSEQLEADAASAAKRQLALKAELAARREALLSAAATERLAAARAVGAADREAERAFAIAEQARSLDTLSQRLRKPGPRAAALTVGSPRFLPPVAAKSAPAGPGKGIGMTFNAAPGALAIAPGAGRVLFAGPYRGFGAVVIIDHGSGWTSLVTGLGKAEVRTGQQLVAGSPLGQSGSGAIGWELRRDGRAVDPADAIAP